jgi:uncharacterized protein (DUF1800 family)
MPATSQISRREFLLKAGALGLSASSLAALVSACHKISPTEEPSRPSSPVPPATSSSTPSPSPISAWKVDLASNEIKMRHLLRRAGFGVGPGELEQFVGMGLAAATDYLIEYQNVDNSALETRLTSLNIDQAKLSLSDIQRWWLVRMIYTKRPLEEKMVLFWHGMLTSAISKVGIAQLMLGQNQLLRDLATADYAVLLKAIARDPAMMLWLDSRLNRKNAPNENFARELMELFTLGIGNYSENDVRESARAFTGWSQLASGFYLDLSQHDSGLKTFLGQTGNLGGDDIIDIIMQQPAAAEFISRKLFEFFTYDNPDPKTVSRLAGVFTTSNRNIKALVRSILTSDEFYSARAYRAKIKSPVELLAGMVRVLGIETGGNELIGPLNNLGQVLFNPPDVSGWKGGLAWINSETLLYRVNFANQLATARGANFKFNPVSLLTQKTNPAPESALADYLAALLDNVIDPQEKTMLIEFARTRGPAQTPKPGTNFDDETLRDLAYLILASPDYQMA